MKCWCRPSWHVSESLEHLLCRLHYNDGRAGGGGHLSKSPVGGHQTHQSSSVNAQSHPPGYLGDCFPLAPEVGTHTPFPGHRELHSTWLPRPGEGLRSRLGWFGGGLQRGVKVISQIKACCRREGIVKTPVLAGDAARLLARIPARQLCGCPASNAASLPEVTSARLGVRLERVPIRSIAAVRQSLQISLA